MRVGRASIRYSKALLGLAIEKKQADTVFGDMQLLSDVIEENRDLLVLLRSPIVRAEKKQAVLDEIFKDIFCELTSSFLAIIIRKGRESLLQQIASAYLMAYKEHNNIVTAEVTTAIKVDDKLRDELLSKIITDKKVELKETVDSDILGGYIIRIGDKQVDASVKKKLNEFRNDFIKS